MITKELLDEYFSGWDTGDIRWKKPTGDKVKIGNKAGCLKDGYLHFQFMHKKYYVHRLVFFYHHDWMPIEVDHKNGIRDDNRIENLRPAIRIQNAQNLKKIKNTTSKYLGVSWHKQKQKWRARIHINGKEIHLGLFDTEEEAYAAYCVAKAELHTFQPTVRRNAYDKVV